MLGTSIGMMNDAYFVGRNQLLAWLNKSFALNYSKVEQCANGAVQCQIFDAMYPGKLPMPRVNFTAKQEYEMIENFKLLQVGLEKAGVAKIVPVQALIRGKYQDNLEFLQWIYNFYTLNMTQDAIDSYDPVAARAKSKGAAAVAPAGAAAASSSAAAAAAPAEAAAAPSGVSAAKKRMSARIGMSATLSAAQLRSMTAAIAASAAPPAPANAPAAPAGGSMRRPLTSSNAAKDNIAAPATGAMAKSLRKGSTGSLRTVSERAAPPCESPVLPRAKTGAAAGGKQAPAGLAGLLSPTSAFMSAFTAQSPAPRVVLAYKASLALAAPASPAPVPATVMHSLVGAETPVAPIAVARRASSPASLLGHREARVTAASAADQEVENFAAGAVAAAAGDGGADSKTADVASGVPVAGGAAAPVTSRLTDAVAQLGQLQEAVAQLEREKEFYLAKIMRVEQLALAPPHAASPLAADIREILYATEAV